MKRITHLLFAILFIFILALPVQAATPKLSKTNVVLLKGKKVTLKAKNAKKVKWSSDNSAVASVSKKGVVKAKKAGTAIISASHSTGVLKCKVTVENPYLSQKAVTITVGEGYNLFLKGTTQKVKWSSSSKKIATVSNGSVVAKKAGKCKITAKISGKSFTCKVTVKNTSKIRQNALSSARSYLRFLSFSRDGLIHQLEYEKYPTADATWAVDHVGADWYKEAVESAKSYLKLCSMSESGLYDQLIFEKFTPEQAKYGVAHSNGNWYQEAKESAASYLRYMSFSHDGLVDQLMYEGFTKSQAEYGVSQNGL